MVPRTAKNTKSRRRREKSGTVGGEGAATVTETDAEMRVAGARGAGSGQRDAIARRRQCTPGGCEGPLTLVRLIEPWHESLHGGLRGELHSDRAEQDAGEKDRAADGGREEREGHVVAV